MDNKIIIEVLAQSDGHRVRGVALTPTEGLARGSAVEDNQPRQRATYDPVTKRLLPLDAQWRRTIEATPWPTRALPEIIAGGPSTLDALTREFLFVSLFRACAESLAAENARRFAAMQGAEQNISDLMGTLTASYNRQRQSAIDEELFDLIAGYEVLRGEGAT